MGHARALHKKLDRIPMAVVQRLISSMTRRCEVLEELTEASDHLLCNNVTFEARPLCNLTRCTAS